MHLAVVGAGWAGLAAAVRAQQLGWDVTIHEMAASPGGRARSYQNDGGSRDNGQHILIGAYQHTLQLMRDVGVDERTVLLRAPLVLQFPDGGGLRVPPGPPLAAALLGIARATGWSWRERLALIRRAAAWRASGFRCAPGLTVDSLCAGMPDRVRADLIEPLCVAALNTRASQASAATFLRVLKDALFGVRGGSDLLLPRVPLSELLPAPAWSWLARQGAELRTSSRVQALTPRGDGWLVDGEPYDAVVLACTTTEAARLVDPHAAAWAACARAVTHEAIASVTLEAVGLRLPAPMVALREDATSPAQFIFDHGALGMEPGVAVAVVSGAAAWLDVPLRDLGERVREQIRAAFPGLDAVGRLAVRHVACEKRATFACTPTLRRPPSAICPGLYAAGDYVEGPYPATLEGAVRSADVALSLCKATFRHAESQA